MNEILLGLVGGNSVLLLYSAFSLSKLHWPVFALISLVIGVLIGLEIPLLVKMFTRYAGRLQWSSSVRCSRSITLARWWLR